MAAVLCLCLPWGLSAQTVFRCGNHYSTTANCADSVPAPVQDTRAAEQAKAQERLTQQTQREAQALEKNRLQAERQATKVPLPPAWPSDKGATTSAVDADTLPPPPHHRKKVSPYFTAKDGSAAPGKKTAAKAKTQANPQTTPVAPSKP